MNKTAIWITVGAVVLIGGGVGAYFMFRKKDELVSTVNIPLAPITSEAQTILSESGITPNILDIVSDKASWYLQDKATVSKDGKSVETIALSRALYELATSKTITSKQHASIVKAYNKDKSIIDFNFGSLNFNGDII